MSPNKSNFLLHIPKYVEASIVISVSGALFGLDTGTIGSITTMPQFITTFGFLSSTVHGLIVSMILIPAATSSFFGGHLANSIGRPRAISLGALIFAIGATLECASVKLAMLIVGRAVKGVGMGLFLSTVVVYITEISPPRSRGTLASIPQLLVTIGVCVGYFTCYGSVKIASSISWRLPFALQAVIGFLFTVATILRCPESPRFLAATGKYQKALASWENLGVGATEREKAEETESLSEPVTIKDLLAVFGKSVWKRTALGVFLMSMQQLSGIDGVLYYAPMLFHSAGLTSSTASFLASGISSIVLFVTTIPAFLYADSWGRKTSTVFGGLTMAATMIIMGSLYASGSVHASYGAARWVVIIMIYLFAASFSGTWAVSFRVYVSEIQPSKTRAGAASLGQSANWIVNWIVAFTTPIFLAHSSCGVYFLFGGSLLLTTAVCILFMPETRGKTLEDIDASFRLKGPNVDVLEVQGFDSPIDRSLREMVAGGGTSSAMFVGVGAEQLSDEPPWNPCEARP